MPHQLKNLFKPVTIGKMELSNRIVMLPLTTGYNETDGTVGDRFIDYFVERAKGGAGLIIVPFTPVNAGSPIQPGLYDDRFMPGARNLTKKIHAYDTKIAVQLIMQYHMVDSEGLPEVVGPSPILNRIMRCVPRPLTTDEIHWIVGEYGKAARRSKDAGFDAVEILVGGGYLLNRFLSPLGNERQDEYGGSLENRMRIILEIIESVRKETGRDYPVTLRINVEEQIKGGHTIDDSEYVVRALERASIQAISCYTGWHESPVPTVQAAVRPGAFVYLAEKVKSWVNIPVIAANRINNPVLAEKILSEGKADLVGMARALFADPEFPRKAREGRVDEIVPCMACSNCLSEVLGGYKKWGETVSAFCSVNPLAGKESGYSIEPAEKSKKVLVIGGGPGGMEAAITAAMRGHDVTLYEKGSELGGMLLIASIPPHKDEVKTLVKSLVARTRKSGVEIKLNTEAGPDTIEREKPDVVILAAGSLPIIPDIPGIDRDNVFTAEDVLTGRKQATGAVIVVGGGTVGCETAEFLLESGEGITEVIIIEMLKRMAGDLSAVSRPFFLERLTKAGIKMETDTKLEEITAEGVRVTRDGVSSFIKGDTIVLGMGCRANKQLSEKLSTEIPEVYSIGDCVQSRMVRDAIEEGFSIGRKI